MVLRARRVEDVHVGMFSAWTVNTFSLPAELSPSLAFYKSGFVESPNVFSTCSKQFRADKKSKQDVAMIKTLV